jgi:hypothetical protein
MGFRPILSSPFPAIRRGAIGDKTIRLVYCPHAGHKKNAWPVVPHGKSCDSSLLLFSDYPTFPVADISRPDTFSVTHTALHPACEETKRTSERCCSARLR